MRLRDHISLGVHRLMQRFGVDQQFRAIKMPQGWAVVHWETGKVGVADNIQAAIADYRAIHLGVVRTAARVPQPPPEVWKDLTGKMRQSVTSSKPSEPPEGSTPTPPPTAPSDE
jgi:hypothetical protein